MSNLFCRNIEILEETKDIFINKFFIVMIYRYSQLKNVVDVLKKGIKLPWVKIPYSKFCLIKLPI